MKWVVGIDEVGRGPLAGPVYVCAVAMPQSAYKKAYWPGLTDSKKMTAKAREEWYSKAESLGITYAVSSRSAASIDKKGIAICIRECVAGCLKKIEMDPKNTTVLLDGGLKAPKEYQNQQTIIKGDLKEKIISFASVIAKVQRDHVMVALSKKHPIYHWQFNKGYGTHNHILALKNKGISPLHRRSFLTKILDI